MSKPSDNDETRIAELAAAWGSDPARWPASGREGVASRLRGSPTLQAVLAREASFERDLNLPAPPGPSMALRARILAAAPAGSAPRVGLVELLRLLWQDIGGLRIAGPAFAGSLALGVMLAVSLQVEPSLGSDDEFATVLLADADYADLLP